MKKFIFFLFLFSFIISSSVSALTFGIDVTEGKEGGFIITEFQAKEFDILDIFQPQAIIPLYVNAGSTINFKGELRKVTTFTDFLFGVPDNIMIRIYKFDSSKPNFKGAFVNEFNINIPESAKQSISNPLTTILIFNAQMTAPTQLGKYRYEAETRFGNFREISMELDYDTFNVQEGVPEICDIASTDTTFQDITGGQLKTITLTQFSGVDCTESTIKTYNSICDDGYRSIGSGASSSCELIPITLPEDIPDETEGCTGNQVCCEYSVFTTPTGTINRVESRVAQCVVPTECTIFRRQPTVKHGNV